VQKYCINEKMLFNKIGYTPMASQAEVHYDLARFKVNVRGRRSGKSYSAAHHALPHLLVPGSRGCVLAPTYDLCDKVMREINKILFYKMSMPAWNIGKIRGGLRYAKLKLGPSELFASEIWARSADNPDSILGEGYDWAIVDEAARISKVVIEQYLRPTLSERKGWVLYITTPNGFNWLYDYYLRGKSNEEKWKNWSSWQHPSKCSTYLPAEELEEVRQELSPIFYKQEYEAKFTSFAGQVYGDFNRQIHAKHVIKYDSRYPLFVAMDFGYRMPAVLWGQIIHSETGPKLVIIDEILHVEQLSTADLKMAILRRNLQRGYIVDKYFCDPAGKGMSQTAGRSDIDVFKDPTIGPENLQRHKRVIRLIYRTDKVATSINNGVKLVRTLTYNAAGVVSLFVSSDCVGFIEDMEKYRYPERKNELSSQPPENPFKDGRNEHGCDSVRIMAVNLASNFKRLVYIKGLVQ